MKKYEYIDRNTKKEEEIHIEKYLDPKQGILKF